jgi:hypothetical protein
MRKPLRLTILPTLGNDTPRRIDNRHKISAYVLHASKEFLFFIKLEEPLQNLRTCRVPLDIDLIIFVKIAGRCRRAQERIALR